MAFYNVSTTQGSSQQIADIPAGESTTFIIYNPTNVSSYFTLETIRNSNGFYDPNSPKNTSGSFTLGPNLSTLVQSDYISSVVIDSSEYANLTFVPATYISASTLFLRGTGPSGAPTWGQAIIDSYISRAAASGSVQQNLSCVSSSLATTPYIESASWVLVPSAIKEDVVLAEVPNTGLGDLTFTRASDATYTDSTGVVRRSPYNLVTWSEMFSDVAWSKLNSTISIDTTVAPNGTLTADTWTGNGTLSAKFLIQTVSIISGRSYTLSVYAKKNTNNFIQLKAGAATFGPDAYANFDLNNGIVGTVGAAATATIKDAGNGWYRCIVTATSTVTTTGSAHVVVLITSATSPVDESNTLSTSVFLWGAQLVEGTSALDYFPTTNRQDVPRIDFRNADGTLSSCGRLLLEPQRTNSLRNSSMVGAVAGSPGTLPTNWGASSVGLTQSIVGTGVEAGLTYIDVRFSGTNTSVNAQILFESQTQITASNAQTWAGSFWFKIISAPTPPVSYQIRFREGTAAGAFVADGLLTFVPTTNLQRFTYVRTNTGALTERIQPAVLFNLTNGATYDFTIRIAAPQMELGAYATTWVPTTTAAVTRIGDAFTRNDIYTNGLISAAGGTWIVDFTNNFAFTVTNEIVSAGLEIGDSAGNSTNSFKFRRGGGIQRINLWKRVSSVDTIIYSPTVDVAKYAIKWNGTTADVFFNGVKVVSATSFTATNMQFLKYFVDQFPMYMNQSILLPTPLSDAECIQLTTL